MESVEDHGCIVDIGISESKAFLSMKEIKEKYSSLEGMMGFFLHH